MSSIEFKSLPKEEELDDAVLNLLVHNEPGAAWVKLTYALRPFLGLTMASAVAQAKIRIIYPEFKR